MSKKSVRSALLSLVVFAFAALAHAQFSSNLEGTVADTTGAIIPGANIQLTNTTTNVSQQVTSGPHGDFRFVSLAPGSYEVVTSAKGFATHKVAIQLTTEQTLNLPVTLGISSESQTVEVTDQAPVLDTAETRNQLTISTEQLDSLPLPGRNQLGLVTLAPGVTGLGVIGSGGNGQSNDNYAAETQVTASANGRSSTGNMFVVDGLDITSNITPGVLNLVPNPDTIQEATVQVNTFNVEYGRSSSIVEVMTTRAGTDKYHFMASDYYTANWLTARTEFQPRETFHMLPFHSDNISTTFGGPIPLLKQAYFFTGWEPLLSATQSSSQITVEDPAFTTWAQQNYPNSIGVKLLAQYPSVNVSRTGVASTGSSLLGTACGTAAGANIPCALPIVDNGVFNATNYRNALEYNIRLDKYFQKDRMYANYYRTSLYTGGPSVRVDHGAPSQYLVRSIQANETHTFNGHLLNEAAFGFLRMEGLIDPTGPFHIPIITLNSGWNTQLGVSKAHENYIQHHFVWKDDVSYVRGRHDIKVGYEGFHGDNLTFFGQLGSQPNFSFLTVPAFVQDQVYQETSVYYNLLTGQQAGLASDSFQFSGNMFGFFAQDNWKINRKLTMIYGLRWDDFGNPSPENGTIEANFFYGTGSTIPQQIANGSVKQVTHAFNQAITAWSPRAGLAYDITGSGKWVMHGGFGLYHDWVTLGNVQNEFANPPAPTGITFTTGTTTPGPLYNVGNSDVYPFGFSYPVLPAGSLNAQGGIVSPFQNGINLAGNDPNLKASNTMNYTVNLERGLGQNFSVAVGYTGAHSLDLFTDFAGHTTNAYYGVDINNFPGSLIQNNGKLVRLNTNFGTIRYTVNGPTSTYNAFITEFKGRFLQHGFIDASYTHSASYDDAGSYPTVPSNTGDYSQYWSRSNWDVPNRLSMQVSYELPHFHHGPDYLHYVTDGWKPSAITILQSGQPFTVLNGNAYKTGEVAGSALATSSAGDYNADGTNSDLPNVPSYGYSIATDRNHQLGRNSNLTPIVTPTGATSPAQGVSGVFPYLSDFTAPSTLPGEGNEIINGYRSPGYANTDFALLKNNRIREIANLQLRLEVFNLFNRASLGAINGSTNSSSFGKATSQYNARFLQLGARLEF
jgi:hypothetical protein